MQLDPQLYVAPSDPVVVTVIVDVVVLQSCIE